MKTADVAVLVIDMNNDHIKNNMPFTSERLRSKIPNIRKFLDEARKFGIPIIYVTDSHRANDWIFSRKTVEPYAIEESWGEEIIQELKPHEDDYVVKKRRFSGFFGTDLDLYLRERKINTLLLVGGPTHVSIRYTAVDAYSLRYNVFVLKDCTDSSTKEFFESALEDMFFTTRIKSINYFSKFRANLLHNMQ